ncbi:hypothetical protein TGRH88_002950 [Toxoplasma gondii]|uniref:Uncharacterized protein n=1 Tax=Toxoplasma gondii TaxID=5811 RepID=A0A7J6KCN6_TOXGO|nr:hypothetical protein TGRH88_002950 [Toxoplasma gondii]
MADGFRDTLAGGWLNRRYRSRTLHGPVDEIIGQVAAVRWAHTAASAVCVECSLHSENAKGDHRRRTNTMIATVDIVMHR